MRRNTNRIFLELVCGVVHDIQMSHQRIALRIDRDKNQIDNRISIQNNGIHYVILVVADSQRRRQGRNKAIEQQIHIVVVDIHIRKDGIHILFYGLSGHYLFETVSAVMLNNQILAVRFMLEILVSQMLTDRKSERRIGARSIDIFLHKTKVLP